MVRSTTAAGSPGEAQSRAVPLRRLPVGQWARLSAVESPPASRRLLDLGFVPGTRVRVIRRAPLGDPVEIEIRGTRLCLRAAQLRGLHVVPEGGHGK